LADWSVVVAAVFVVVTVVVADWTFVVAAVVIIAVKGVGLVEKYVLFSSVSKQFKIDREI